MKKTMKRHGARTMLVLLGVLLLSGCATQTAQNQAGSGENTQLAAQETVEQNSTANTQMSSESLIQKAFGVSVIDVTPEVTVFNDVRQETYALDTGKVVITQMDGGVPDSLYYFQENVSTEEPAVYSYPNTIAADAQTFLQQVFGIETGSTTIGIYGYQNRIGVLLSANDGSYFHVQFMPDDNKVIGCQHFIDLESAETFYAKQNATRLS